MRSNSKSKGFLHAVDAGIASFVLLFFVGSIFTAPQPPEWDKMHVRKAGEDVLWTLGKTGYLDSFVSRGDSDSLRSVVKTLNPSIDYYIQSKSLPDRSIKIGNLIDSKSTNNKSSTTGDWGGSGLPKSEDDRYRKGTIYDIKFVLSDQYHDGRTKFTNVNFDIDGDNYFNGSNEGGTNGTGFSNDATFTCNQGPPNKACDGDMYEIHLQNDTLNLYNFSYTHTLLKKIKNTDINGIDISFSFDGINPRIESVAGSDILIAKDWDTEELRKSSSTLRAFMRREGTLIEIKNLTKNELDEFHREMDFKWINYSVNGSGKERSVFNDGEVGELSYEVSKYFYNTPISLKRGDDLYQDFNGSLLYNNKKRLYHSNWYIKGITSNQNNYIIGNLTLTGTKYHTLLTNNSDEYDRVYFSKDTNFSDESFYEEGDIFQTSLNDYELKKIAPLKLSTNRSYLFRNLRFGKIRGNDDVLVSTNRSYNISESNRLIDTSQTSCSYLKGVPKTSCSQPYRCNYSFYSGGDEIQVVMTNKNVSGTCDNEFELINFNFDTSDNDFNDSEEDTPSGYGREGPYLEGEIAWINDKRYELIPKSNGDYLLLKRKDEDYVSALKASQGFLAGKGSAFLFPSLKLGDDEFSLIRSIAVSQTSRVSHFTPEREFADLSIGIPWSGSLKGDVYIPYSLKTVWWYS